MNHQYGTMADLSRLLGISRSAVSKAFKKHGIQKAADGRYNLDYMKWLLSEKQNQQRSAAQRSAKKQLPGLKNPRLKREVLRLMTPIWQAAIIETLAALSEGFLVDAEFESDDDIQLMGDFYITLKSLWTNFHALADAEFQKDDADFDFEKPDCLVCDLFDGDLLANLIKIGAIRSEPDTTNRFENLPLDELEALVVSMDFPYLDDIENV